jgi:hypothetical protein
LEQIAKAAKRKHMFPAPDLAFDILFSHDHPLHCEQTFLTNRFMALDTLHLRRNIRRFRFAAKISATACINPCYSGIVRTLPKQSKQESALAFLAPPKA